MSFMLFMVRKFFVLKEKDEEILTMKDMKSIPVQSATLRLRLLHWTGEGKRRVLILNFLKLQVLHALHGEKVLCS